MKKTLIFLLTVGLALYSQAAQAGRSGERVLLDNYLRYQVFQKVTAQANKLAETRAEKVQTEVREETAWWMTAQNKSIKADLERAFGDKASSEFQSFWMAYENAEAAKDKAYFDKLCMAVGLTNAAGYASLRKSVLNSSLAHDIADSGAILSAVESWLDAVADGKLQQGTLKKWVNGDIGLRKKVISDPLQAAEAEAEPFIEDPKAKDDNPLDAYKSMREAKRKKAHDEAKAGMVQVAAERKAAEADYAAKVQARAAAEAANLKKHADRLSAAEKEAFEQRKKSFGNRLKNVVSATIGAATGAFTGGVGARAGQAAVDSIWGNASPAAVAPLPPGGAAPIQPPQQPVVQP